MATSIPAPQASTSPWLVELNDHSQELLTGGGAAVVDKTFDDGDGLITTKQGAVEDIFKQRTAQAGRTNGVDVFNTGSAEINNSSPAADVNDD